MWTDIVDLESFYATPQGQLVRRLLRRCLRELWPDLSGCRLAGLGYAPPILQGFQREAERTLALMPARLGASRWPADRALPSLTALVDDLDLPLPDRSLDRLLLIHALESADHVRGMLRECWRVLADTGRLVVVVPNRVGLWARREGSPFATGQPYTPAQLAMLLRESMFAPTVHRTALFPPPVRRLLLLSPAITLERLGQRWVRGFGGVVVMECSKQMVAPVLRLRSPSRVPLILPAPSPNAWRDGSSDRTGDSWPDGSVPALPVRRGDGGGGGPGSHAREWEQ